MKTYYRVLTIAGSDSGGGAGIQADLKTFAASGCYGMSVITAITAQNTHSVTDIHPVPPASIAKQIDAVMEDIGADAIKIGMLHSPEVIGTVAGCLTRYHAQNIVVDPVMVSKSGDHLLRDDAVEALKTILVPMATLITPNIPEAMVLLQRSHTEMPLLDNMHCLEAVCEELAGLGAQAVLLKGGHLTSGQSPDILYSTKDEAFSNFEGKRINTINTHGTGCTLSSAIAANLAKGDTLQEAVFKAKEYVTQALKAGVDYRVGRGHGPVHHFYNVWR